MLRKAILFIIPFAFAVWGWSAISAQELTASERDRLTTELYSQGVHAYFDGQYTQSLERLTQAIELKTTDPRVFYYRGLAQFELGNAEEARGDFLLGAEMELAGTPQFYPINRSLERIQGDRRLLLEQTRAFAREEAVRKRDAYRAARYERIRLAEDLVLRKPIESLPQLPDVDLSKIPNVPFQGKPIVGNN